MPADTAPFAILALGPFAGEDALPRPSLAVTRETLDAAVADLAPQVAVQVPAALNPQGVLSFSFACLADFHPDSFGGGQGAVAEATRAAAFVDAALAAETAAADIHARLSDWPGLRLSLAPPAAPTQPARPAAKGGSAADRLFDLVDAPGAEQAGQAQAAAWKDAALARRQEALSLVFQDAGFRRMEAAWRGVEFLLQRPGFGPGGRCALALAPAGAKHLDKCLGALEVLMATETYSLVLADTPLDSSQVGCGRMARLAALAGRFLVPVAAWIDKGFFHMPTWKDFDALPGVGALLDGPAYIPWRKLRTSGDAAWLTLLAGRFLARTQYGPANPADCGLTEAAPNWAAPVWALGALAADAAQDTGWPGAFTRGRGLSGIGLPANMDQADAPTEVAFSDRRALQLIEAGLTPLRGVRREDRALLPRAVTVGGAPLDYALFMNLLTRHVYALQAKINHHLSREDTEREISKSFANLWATLGSLAPQSFTVNLGQGQPGAPLPLKIELTPAATVLPGNPKISLDFEW